MVANSTNAAIKPVYPVVQTGNGSATKAEGHEGGAGEDPFTQKLEAFADTSVEKVTFDKEVVSSMTG